MQSLPSREELSKVNVNNCHLTLPYPVEAIQFTFDAPNSIVGLSLISTHF